MTEQEWLTNDNPLPMIAQLRLRAEAGFHEQMSRKLQLFCCACNERCWSLGESGIRWYRMEEFYETAEKGCVPSGRTSLSAISHAEAWGYNCLRPKEGPTPKDKAALLRDIFGNPFRPVTLPIVGSRCEACKGRGLWLERCEVVFKDDSHSYVYECPGCNGSGKLKGECPWLTWNDAAVPRIAQKMYDERDFTGMPILADALEEAGCDDARILDHCRNKPVRVNTGPGDYGDEWLTIPVGPHVRGCWVVDLILGKR